MVHIQRCKTSNDRNVLSGRALKPKASVIARACSGIRTSRTSRGVHVADARDPSGQNPKWVDTHSFVKVCSLIMTAADLDFFQKLTVVDVENIEGKPCCRQRIQPEDLICPEGACKVGRNMAFSRIVVAEMGKHPSVFQFNSVRIMEFAPIQHSSACVSDPTQIQCFGTRSWDMFLHLYIGR